MIFYLCKIFGNQYDYNKGREDHTESAYGCPEYTFCLNAYKCESGDVRHHGVSPRLPRSGESHGCRRVAKRWTTTKASSRTPVMMRIQYELSDPSKEISVLMMPSTRTPSNEPTT